MLHEICILLKMVLSHSFFLTNLNYSESDNVVASKII